jgi:hypothetical protein
MDIGLGPQLVFLSPAMASQAAAQNNGAAVGDAIAVVGAAAVLAAPAVGSAAAAGGELITGAAQTAGAYAQTQVGQAVVVTALAGANFSNSSDQIEESAEYVYGAGAAGWVKIAGAAGETWDWVKEQTGL